MEDSEKPRLIAISVRSIQNEPYVGPDMRMAQSANIRGESDEPGASFVLKTGLLNPEQVRRCALLSHHGFTVVELPCDWRSGRDGRDGWKDTVIKQAMERVASLYPDGEGVKRMAGYDEQLAQAILEILNEAHPTQVGGRELKSKLKPEPSDDELYSALDALEIDGYIKIAGIRSGIYNKLGHVAFVSLTTEGRRHLSNKANPITAAGSVFHGDQINNYGNAGAIGRHSQGVVNANDRWSQIASETDLPSLAVELERLRIEYQKVALSREDAKQLVLLGDAAEEAEKGNGEGMAAHLSRIGTNVLKVAQDIGTDIAAKVIVELAKG